VIWSTTALRSPFIYKMTLKSRTTSLSIADLNEFYSMFCTWSSSFPDSLSSLLVLLSLLSLMSSSSSYYSYSIYCYGCYYSSLWFFSSISFLLFLLRPFTSWSAGKIRERVSNRRILSLLLTFSPIVFLSISY